MFIDGPDGLIQCDPKELLRDTMPAIVDMPEDWDSSKAYDEFNDNSPTVPIHARDEAEAHRMACQYELDKLLGRVSS